jgi:hypothetical protein
VPKPELLLYLDFDGVLHSADPARADYFCWRPILAGILEPFPNVKIVVSSDWRARCSDDQLKHNLGQLGERFVGITHTMGSDRAEEIMADVSTRRIKHWLALDDHETVRQAAKRIHRFVWCPPMEGISCPEAQRRVVELLQL